MKTIYFTALISLFTVGLAFADPVTCSLIYMSDMNDQSTLTTSPDPIRLSPDLPPVNASGLRQRGRLAKGFRITIKMEPMVDGDQELSHGYNVSLQVEKGNAASYATTYANPRERFRRLSGIMGFGKEQMTVNCDLVP
ncbi:MAG: hypothetical protein HY074_16975 [Deltaproteobacteria bacterium]|nr:hypothetical protein [Deltaproteobacteria bacterium]